MVGRRHYEVAKLLKDIPKGSVFTLRLIEPLKVGFCTLFLNKIYKRKVNFKCNKYNCTSFFFFYSANIESRGSKRGKGTYGNGKETLRFKANGATQIQKEVHRKCTYYTLKNPK